MNADEHEKQPDLQLEPAEEDVSNRATTRHMEREKSFQKTFWGLGPPRD